MSKSPMDEVKAEYKQSTFDEAMDSSDSPLETISYLLARGYNDLTIKEVEALTGLTRVYIRRRVQEGRWADPRTYDGAGRLLIPTVEVRTYLQVRSAREGTAYIIRLSPEEVATFKATFPDKPLTPRYDPEKARKYRARKAAEASAGGVKLGKLNL